MNQQSVSQSEPPSGPASGCKVASLKLADCGASIYELAKQVMTIPEAWELLELGGRPGKITQSPFRDDHNPSFSIYDNGTRYTDHATGDSGDVINFVADGLKLTEGRSFSNREAAEWIINMHIKLGGEVPSAAPKPLPVKETHTKPALPALRSPTEVEMQAIAGQRKVDVAGCRLAMEWGLLHVTDYAGHACWTITDSTRWNAQFRRMDGKPFTRADGTEFKAMTVKGAWAGWPIGASDIGEDVACVLMVEGSGDFIAAHHFLALSIRSDDYAVVCMSGASMNIPDEALVHFCGKYVRLFPHVDTAGVKAARRWAEQLQPAVSRVDAMNLSGLTKTDGTPVKDLNDLTSLAASHSEADINLRHICDF